MGDAVVGADDEGAGVGCFVPTVPTDESTEGALVGVVPPTLLPEEKSEAFVGDHVACALLGAMEGCAATGIRVPSSKGAPSFLLPSIMLRLCRASKAETTIVVTAKTRIINSSRANFP